MDIEKKRERDRRYYYRTRRNRPLTLEQKLNKRKLSSGQQQKVKLEVLTHYGHGKSQCVYCGESRLACLSLDHVNNNGCQERRKTKKYGIYFYRWLKKENYPLGYQTLCMNCQFIKMKEYNGVLARARFASAFTLSGIKWRINGDTNPTT